MDAISPWLLILLLLLGGAIAGEFVLRFVGRKGDERSKQVLDLIETVLETVKREVQGAMKDVPVSEVEAAATAVYRQYVAGSVLEKVMTEHAFVGVVVKRWRLLAGVEDTAFRAMQLQRTVAGG